MSPTSNPKVPITSEFWRVGLKFHCPTYLSVGSLGGRGVELGQALTATIANHLTYRALVAFGDGERHEVPYLIAEDRLEQEQVRAPEVPGA